MSSKLLKSFRNGVVGAFLVAGCGGYEPIPVNLETAAGPCDHGAEFVTDGMKMVIQDGQLMVVPKVEGEVQSAWVGYVPPKGSTTQAGCEGCH